MFNLNTLPGEKIVVTNRHLCEGNFLEQISLLASLPVDRIILREKDLSESEYEVLAKQVLSICNEHHIPCTLHTFYKTAKKLGCTQIHLPFSLFVETMQKNPDALVSFSLIGTSVHSLDDALLAEKLGAGYITAGHIFSTQCKPDLAPRGLVFLHEITSSVSIPVYAIGGISPENTGDVIKAGAIGACMMSRYMKLRI
ncbi:MAG: thiamine phosphate synthase [Lachnospiraceae bacterium]